MVLIGLLLVAVVCLALGLVLASAWWLVGCLVATAAAAWVLWRGRDRLGPARDALALPTPTPEGGAVAARTEASPAALVQSDYARRRADALGATALSDAPPPGAEGAGTPVDQPPAEAESAVWVIDGRPHYHRAGCPALLGGEPEAIPFGQAVEDGFAPCPRCNAAPGAGGAAEPTVWVADGRPHYHDPDCAVLASSGPPEPVPFAQAVADGFTPCPGCQATDATPPQPERPPQPEQGPEPGPEAAAQPPQPASPLAEVWVVAGRPRYHLADCMIIGEQGAVVRTLSDARSEGFKPCSLCDPPA